VREAFAERRRPARLEIGRHSQVPAATTRGWPPLADMEELSTRSLLGSGSRGRRSDPKKRGRACSCRLLHQSRIRPVAPSRDGGVSDLLHTFVGSTTRHHTSVITLFVVSLSTIGSSNQKGLLRFAGAASGTDGFGRPCVRVFRTSTDRRLLAGLRRPALQLPRGSTSARHVSRTAGTRPGSLSIRRCFRASVPRSVPPVLRDRLMASPSVLIVFGLLEHVLWPVRAADRHCVSAWPTCSVHCPTCLACAKPGGLRSSEVTHNAPHLAAVADVQGFIESSKFESDAAARMAIQRADRRCPERLPRSAGDRPPRGCAPPDGS